MSLAPVKICNNSMSNQYNLNDNKVELKKIIENEDKILKNELIEKLNTVKINIYEYYMNYDFTSELKISQDLSVLKEVRPVYLNKVSTNLIDSIYKKYIEMHNQEKKLCDCHIMSSCENVNIMLHSVINLQEDWNKYFVISNEMDNYNKKWYEKNNSRPLLSILSLTLLGGVIPSNSVPSVLGYMYYTLYNDIKEKKEYNVKKKKMLSDTQINIYNCTNKLFKAKLKNI
jgi:hypothetical protein